jgi:putative phosphoribosyl transferase
MQHYRDRTEAGWRLAAHLAGYYGSADVLVLAMTRGGVPVAYEVAEALGAQLDIFLVQELFLPAHEDRPIGIICSGGMSLFNDWVAQKLRIPKKEVEKLAAESQRKLEQRELYYRSGCATPELQNRILILVDDGLSSGLMFRIGEVK